MLLTYWGFLLLMKYNVSISSKPNSPDFRNVPSCTSLCRVFAAVLCPHSPSFFWKDLPGSLNFREISAASFLCFYIKSVIMYPLDDTRIHPNQRFVNPFFRVLSHCMVCAHIFVHGRQTVGYKKASPLRRLLQKTRVLRLLWRTRVLSFFYSSRFLKYPSAQ